MRRVILLLLASLLFPCFAGCQSELGYSIVKGAEALDSKLILSETDWPWWRGPDRDGIAPQSARPPVKLGEEQLLWKAPIPGRGHSSAIIVGDRVFLTTADEQAQTQSVICLARKDGELLWRKQLHEGGFDHNNKKNSFASSSAACDGQRVGTYARKLGIRFMSAARNFSGRMYRRVIAVLSLTCILYQ